MPFTFDDALLREGGVGLLGSFLEQLEAMLRTAVWEGSIGGRDIRDAIGEDAGALQAIEADLQERDAYRVVIAALPASRAGLQNAGLWGGPLGAKMHLLAGAAALLENPVRHGVRKVLKYLLTILNSILSSLAKALGPLGGGVVHGIKELKDLIEAKIDLASD